MTSHRLLIALGLLALAVVALGFQVYRFARGAGQVTTAVADQRPLAPPVSGPKLPIVLYLAADQDGGLHRTEIKIPLPTDPNKRAKEILRALVAQYQESASPHAVGAGADINEVYLVDQTLAVIDTNAVFADGHPSGILVEELTLASMAETLAANLPGLTRIKLLIDGKERATLAGHADLTEPYDVNRAAALVK